MQRNPFVLEHGGVDYIVKAIKMFDDAPDSISGCAHLLPNLLAVVLSVLSLLLVPFGFSAVVGNFVIS